MDLAGFRRGDGFAWGMAMTWRERCRRGSYRWRKKVEWDEEDWVNVTGVLSGEWVRYIGNLSAKEKTSGYLNLGKIATGVDWAFWDPEDWMMNVKGNEGRVMLKIDEKASLEIEVEEEPDTVEEESELGVVMKTGIGRDTALVREVAATMTVQDESISDDGWEMRVYGVHWPRIGALLMTTTSEKFAGIFGLPHLGLGNDYFMTSQRLLNAAIEKTLGKAAWFDASNPWTASPGAKADAWRPVQHCEYVVYVQVHPRKSAFIDKQPNAQNMSEIEREMRCPYGATILRTPKLQMSTVIFSPDCGFILEPKGPPTFSSPDRQHFVCKEREEP